MYKNQLQELAQRSCFNLPSYSCVREGPDHAPRFKATVNFNGETFDSPNFCTTLRQAEHAAAEVALNSLSKQGPSRSLAARVLDETGVYKNLLQETAHRAGLNLPVYTTIRSGPGHTPIFTCTVELAGMSFTGDPTKTKKQAQKNAAMAAWSALKQLSHLGACSLPSSSSQMETERNEEQEQVIIARALAKLQASDGSKPIQQTDSQGGRHKQVPVWREASRTNATPFYPVMPCQGWMQSNFFPDISVYQTWHQDASSTQRCNFLTLPLSSLNDPRTSCMRPSMHSVQGPYMQVMEQNHLNLLPSFVEAPPMYFPVYHPQHSECRSQVSIQEIQEEKSGLGKTWFTTGGIHSDGESSHRLDSVMSSNFDYKLVPHTQPSIDTSPDSTNLLESHDKQATFTQSASEMTKGGITSGSSSFQPRADESYSSLIHDPSSTSSMHLNSLHKTDRDRCEWMNREQRSRHRRSWLYGNSQSTSVALHPPDTTTSLGLLQGFQHPHKAGFSTVPVCHTGIRPNDFRCRGLSMASPVTMRTATPVCSARPGRNNLNSRGLSSDVPSVHIRTVQPVFSAPATRTSVTQRRSQDSECLSQTSPASEGISPTVSSFSELNI